MDQTTQRNEDFTACSNELALTSNVILFVFHS